MGGQTLRLLLALFSFVVLLFLFGSDSQGGSLHIDAHAKANPLLSRASPSFDG